MSETGARMLMQAVLPSKYTVGKTYAIQPGRGKKSLGRIRIISVEKQALRDITQEDAVAEGFSGYFEWFPTDQFFDYWCRLYRIINNEVHSDLDLDEQVWRIEFELEKS